MTHGDDPNRWGERDWRAARESWRRRRMAEGAAGPRGRPPWVVARGFGCLFALIFLVIAGSVVAGSAFVLASLGPVPGLIALAFVVVLLSWMGRTLLVTGRALDRLVEATRRVDGKELDLSAARGLEPMERVEHCMVLNRSREDADTAPVSGATCPEDALQGEVVGLRAAGGEDDLAGARAHRSGDRLARLFNDSA